MNEQVATDIVRNALLTALLVCSPVILITLGVGVIVSILQSVTQINEATLTFIPKIIAAFLALIIFMPWMMQMVGQFTLSLVSNMNAFIAH